MTELKKLQDLLSKMDYIEGTTEGGRYFKIELTEEGPSKTQIFDNGNVYEPSFRITDIIGHNILSRINNIETTFFGDRSYAHRSLTRTKRKEIHIVGYKDDDKFTIDLEINNDWSQGNLYFRGGSNPLTMKNTVPEHIPANQKHNWLYFHYQKPENWISILEYNIKGNYYRCCGQDISGKWYYCHFCGKKQEVNGIVLDTIVGKELLTKLT